MRLIYAGAALAAGLFIAACNPPSATEAPAAPEAELATFEDNSCIAYLLLQRNAIAQGAAQGDEAALTAALEAWRASAAGILTADELAQYEASSFAVEDDTDAATLQTRAASCVQTAPRP